MNCFQATITDLGLFYDVLTKKMWLRSVKCKETSPERHGSCLAAQTQGPQSSLQEVRQMWEQCADENVLQEKQGAGAQNPELQK